jgi:hypothetical protein
LSVNLNNMATKESLKQANSENIRTKTADGSVTRKAIADGIDAGLDYTDQQVKALEEKLVTGDDLAEALQELETPIEQAAQAANAAGQQAEQLGQRVSQLENSPVTGYTDEKAAAAAQQAVTKQSLGLSSVDNTADTAKPVSTAQATADTQAKNDAISTVRGGVVPEGDTLAKLFALIGSINAIIGSGVADGDSLVNTVTELLAVFQNAPESLDIISVLNAKLDVASLVNTLTETTAGKALDARQGTALKLLIDTLTQTVSGKVDKVLNKGLSTNDYSNADKQIVSAVEIPGAYNLRAGLIRWRQALRFIGKLSSGLGLGGIDILCFGTSVLEGYNSSSPTFDSFIHRLKVYLQRHYNPSGVLGGYGFMPFVKGGPDGWNPFVTRFGTLGSTNGAWSVKGKPVSAAPGANGLYMTLSKSNDVGMRTASTDVQFVGFQFSGYGNARWDVNPTTPGAAGIGTGAQTGTHNQLVSSGFHSGNRFGTATTPGFAQRIGLDPTVSNVVQWAAPDTTGNAAYDGLICYNGDFTCGVRLHDLAVFGSTIQSMSGFIRDGYGGGAGSFVTWGQGLTTGGACNAKLMIMDFIANDCGYAATPTVPLSTFLNLYGQAIDYQLAQNSKPAVLLIIPLMPTDTLLAARTTVGERWSDYVAGIYGLVDQRTNVALLDLNVNLGASAGLLDDHVHPNNPTQVAVAQALFQVLT